MIWFLTWLTGCLALTILLALDPEVIEMEEWDWQQWGSLLLWPLSFFTLALAALFNVARGIKEGRRE